jgi:hypothetical protein
LSTKPIRIPTIVAALGGWVLAAAVGTDVRPWKPAGISSPKFESHAAFDPRRKLGPAVNVNGTEIGALFSPSGRSLLFARDTRGADSGEFFVWYEHGPEAWPPDCPEHKR